jgi:hypothetical protein
MKWKLSIFTLIIILVIGIFYQPFMKKESRESITFFPLDSSYSFEKAETSLSLLNGTPTAYDLSWTVQSESSERVYLRQDFSMVFQNGILNNKMTEWKTSAKSIEMKKQLTGETPSLWEAVTFHQGEIHIDEEKYRSIQKMSSDFIYTVLSEDAYSGFKQPKNATERRLKNELDEKTNQFLQKTLAESLAYFQLNRENYEVISLKTLTEYNQKPLPGFSQEKSQEIIGKLWEGLYKNYFLNITTKTGQKISPIGSSMPYILLSKDKTHLFVLFKTVSGENIQLIQYIS